VLLAAVASTDEGGPRAPPHPRSGPTAGVRSLGSPLR